MESGPYHVTRSDGIVTLTLDTPGSEVNILSNEAAEQILQVLADVRPGDTRAVVFATAKEASYINGVGLMMAIAARSPESARMLTEQVRAAYAAVRACPVPTVAAIQGNCYGCGVEFSLCCDHRVAADTVSTHFYMTELNDYLFNPVFEGTLRLPLLLGLEAAIDLLLWGQRWSAQQALARGLVGEVIGHRDFEAGLRSFVDSRAEAENEPERSPANQAAGLTDHDRQVIRENLARIGRLPPAYQAIYRNCLGLMVHVRKRGQVTEAARRRELMLAGTSSCRRTAKNAFSFFFIRQMARQITQGQPAPARRPQILSFDPDSEGLEELWADLVRRSLPDVDVFLSAVRDGSGPHPIFFLTESESRAPGLPDPEGVIPVGVQLTALGRAPAARAPLLLHGPGYPTGPPLFELAITNGAAIPARELYQTLSRTGFEVVLTRPRDRFVLDAWLLSYLRPLIAYCQAGGRAADVNASLRRFGFVRRPHAVLEHHPSSALEPLLQPSPDAGCSSVTSALETLRSQAYEDGHFDQRVVDSLLLSLLAATRQCLEEGSLLHPSQADLIAREAFDFPLRFGSLCRFTTPRRVAAILGRAASIEALVSRRTLEIATDFAGQGKQFYL